MDPLLTIPQAALREENGLLPSAWSLIGPTLTVTKQLPIHMMDAGRFVGPFELLSGPGVRYETN